MPDPDHHLAGPGAGRDLAQDSLFDLGEAVLDHLQGLYHHQGWRRIPAPLPHLLDGIIDGSPPRR